MAKFGGSRPDDDLNKRDHITGLRKLDLDTETNPAEELLFGGTGRRLPIAVKIEAARNFLLNPSAEEDFKFALKYLGEVIVGKSEESSDSETDEIEILAHKTLVSVAETLANTTVTKLGDERCEHLSVLVDKYGRSPFGKQDLQDTINGKKSDILQAIFLLRAGSELLLSERNQEVIGEALSSPNSAIRFAAVRCLANTLTSGPVFENSKEFSLKFGKEMVRALFSYQNDAYEQFGEKSYSRGDVAKWDEVFVKFIKANWCTTIEDAVIAETTDPCLSDEPAEIFRNNRHREEALKLLCHSKSQEAEIAIERLFLDSPHLFVRAGIAQLTAAPYLQKAAGNLLNRNAFNIPEQSTAEARDSNEAALQLFRNLPDNSPIAIFRLIQRRYENPAFYAAIGKTFEDANKNMTAADRESTCALALASLGKHIDLAKLDTLKLITSEEARLRFSMRAVFPSPMTGEMQQTLRTLTTCGIPSVEMDAALKLGCKDEAARQIVFHQGQTYGYLLRTIVFAQGQDGTLPEPGKPWLKEFLIEAKDNRVEALIRRQIRHTVALRDFEFYGDILAERFKQKTSKKGINEILNILKVPPYKDLDLETSPLRKPLARLFSWLEKIDAGHEIKKKDRESREIIQGRVALRALTLIRPEEMSAKDKAKITKALIKIQKDGNSGLRRVADELSARFRG